MEFHQVQRPMFIWKNPFSTKKPGKVYKFFKIHPKSPVMSGNHRKSREFPEKVLKSLTMYFFAIFNVFYYKIIIQWSFIKFNANLSLENHPFQRKSPEKFSNFSNITGKVRLSTEKYGNVWKSLRKFWNRRKSTEI